MDCGKTQDDEGLRACVRTPFSRSVPQGRVNLDQSTGTVTPFSRNQQLV
jgi:hypothetical protein